MAKVPTWGDLKNAPWNDIKRIYKLTDSQLEMGVRRHLDGASKEEMKSVYKEVWTPGHKR
jgi:hypothetical protein